MNLRRTLFVGCVLVAVAAAPSYAAKPKAKPKALPPAKVLTIVDQAGDANGINSQSHLADEAGDPSRPGPGQRTAADILSVTFTRLDDTKAVKGFTAAMKLSAAPEQGTIYRIQAAAGDCTQFWISYNFPLGGAAVGNLRENCSGAVVNTPLTPVIKDATITFALPFTVLPKNVKLGTAISGVFGETKGHPTGVTAPTIDETAISPDVYTIGQ